VKKIETIMMAVVLSAGYSSSLAGTLTWQQLAPSKVDQVCQPVLFEKPHAVGVDGAGNVYVTNEKGSKAVQAITPEGSIRTALVRNADTIKSGDYYGLSLAIDASDSVYLGVKKRGTVEKLSADGTLTLMAGSPGDTKVVDGAAPAGRFNSLTALSIDRHGVIYVADGTLVRKVSLDGTISTLAGSPKVRTHHGADVNSIDIVDGKGSRARFSDLRALVIDDAGNIYVADGYEGPIEGKASYLAFIRKVTPDGSVSVFAGNYGIDIDGVGTAAGFAFITGLAIDTVGNLYAAEDAPSIRKISREGSVTTLTRDEMTDGLTAPLYHPTGIAVARDGKIYLADAGTNHLFRLDSSHQLETLCEMGASHRQ